MLVTLKEILKIAEAKKCAVGSFNTPNLTTIKAVIGAAEEMGVPVIIMHAQVHEEMGLCKLDDIIPLMVHYAKSANVPVCVHLDHGEDLRYLARALALGCTSVMYDGSTLDPKTNVENTIAAVVLAKLFGASVEAEIGSMGSRESGAPGGDSIYTDPEEAASFVQKTGIDALACAFGTAHGIYLKAPKLDFERLEKIKSRVGVPIVMHGGSGVSEEDYRRVISIGVRKINYYTYMAKAGAAVLRELSDKSFFHDIEVAAEKGMKEDVKKALAVFSGKR